MKLLKNVWFWIILTFSLYTFVGFVFLPWFITKKFPSILSQKTGIHLQIKKSSFNPYNFTLALNDVTLFDQTKKPAVSFESLQVDYDLFRIFEGLIFFRSVQIQSPTLYAILQKDGKFNLESILPPSEQNEQEVSQNESKLFLDIILNKIALQEGKIIFKDARESKIFTMDLGPYTFNAHDITTRAGDIHAHDFHTYFTNGGELFWQGGMSLKPLKFYGHVEIKKLALPKLYDYAFTKIPASLQNGLLNLYLPYQVKIENDLQISVNSAKASFENVFFHDQNGEKLLGFDTLQIEEISSKWPQQKITIKNVNLNMPKVFAKLNADNSINLKDAFMLPSQKHDDEKSQNEDLKPWQFLLKNTQIKSGNIFLSDLITAKASHNHLQDLNIIVKDFSSDKAVPIHFKMDSILNKKTKVNLGLQYKQNSKQISGDLALKNLPFIQYKHYLPSDINVDIIDGYVNLDSKISAIFDSRFNFDANSNLQVDDLHINTLDQKPLLKWKKLAVNGVDYKHKPQQISIADIFIQEPYVRAHINKNANSNFSKISTQEESKTVKSGDEKEPLHLKIGPITVENGSSDFSDLSLPFPFETHMHDLNGEISTLDFLTTTPSKISLKGKIDTYGLAEISGELLPLKIKKQANINVLMKNIDLSNLTPYSGKFVGYAIKEGKLTMDLQYKISDSTLKGTNKINIDTLNLGDKIESPDAVDLPLQLAIALLKDSNNQIDINLPVAGDMDNPKFSYGSIIWKAIGNLITGIVTAPFKFLGSLLGVDGDALKSIDFDHGSIALLSSEHEKLNNIQKIMGKRPNIKLSISGSYDKDVDTIALKKARFEKALETELKTIFVDKNATEKIDTYSLALQSMYTTAYSHEKYINLQKDFLIKIENSKQSSDQNSSNTKSKKVIQIDQNALNDEIVKQLTNKIQISNEDLKLLGDSRAKNLVEVLQKEYKIPSKRIIIKETQTVKAKQDRWVPTSMDISI